MNPQISFSTEEIKDNLSTPTFPKNKSVYSLEKEENTLDTLRQHFDKVYNDKDTLNNENINESKNDKKILINSLLNNNSNLDLNNLYMSQFSFDEKSSNFLTKKENKESTNEDNKLILVDELDKEKNKIKDENNSEENENDNEIKYINKITNDDIDKNDDSNFDYELPLGSDDNPEFFFSQNNEELKEKEQNQDKIEKDDFLHLKECDCDSEKKKIEKILTPQKKIKNKMSKKINSAKILNNENQLLNSRKNKKNIYIPKFNSSNKKINKILKFSSLIDDYKVTDYFPEKYINNINSNIYSNSQKNTYFTSKDNNSKKQMNYNDKLIINPFTIEKIENNESLEDKDNNSRIKSNIIKDITLSYYNKRNKKNRNSVNFTERNNNFICLDNDKNKIIYEKNLSIEEPRSFSISQKGTHSHSHSRNYKDSYNKIKNETISSSNYFMNKRLKNCVILLTKNKNLKPNNSLKNISLSENQNFSQKSLEKKIEGKTERCSPFRKSRISDSFMTKNTSYKNYMLNNNQLMQNRNDNIIDNKLQFLVSKTSNNFPFENKGEIKKKEKIDKNKIKINNKNNSYINNQMFKNKGNLTQRNKDIGPVNIYSRKLVYIPNGNKKYNSNKSNQLSREKTLYGNYNLKKNNINKSYIIPKEKNIKIIPAENEKAINKINARKKFNEYFNEILSNINITKTITNPRSNINNKLPKEQKEKHKIRKIIQFSNLNMNTMTTKTIQVADRNKNSLKSKFLVKKINNNKIKNNNYINNTKYNNNSTLTHPRKSLIELFKNNILNYSINRNNRNNQVKNEVSIFIGDNKNKNNKTINVKRNLLNNRNNNKIHNLGKNKKTIINVNQYYSSYYIKK